MILKSKFSKLKHYFLLIGVLLAWVISIAVVPYDTEEIYLKNYLLDSVLLLASIVIFIFFVMKNNYRLFSPITFFSALYLTMFFVTPMYDILSGEFLWFGVDLFEHGIKGSLLAFLGYIVFLVGFCSFNKDDNAVANINEEKIENTLKLRVFILFMYAVCLVANIYYVVMVSGNSLLYIFTVGLLGEGNSTETTEASIGAISMLSYALPSVTLLYCEYGKSKILKIIFFVLMFNLQVTRGFRFLVIQIVIMFVAYYFMSKNKHIKLKQALLIIFVAMIPILIMTIFRNSIRAGGGVSMESMSAENISLAMEQAIWDNFRIYKTYYGIIRAVPEKTGYLYGGQIIVYTLIMFIPRAIWKNKPGNPGTEAQLLGINEAAVKGGSAYPCLGEFYYDSGIFGVVFWMLIFSLLYKKVYKRYCIKAKSKLDLMYYSTFLGLILQLVIRGYTPSNFWMVFFCILPFWFVRLLFMGGLKKV